MALWTNYYYYFKTHKKHHGCLHLDQRTQEIKECPRKFKGIESIITQISLQIAQEQAKYLSSLIFADM